MREILDGTAAYLPVPAGDTADDLREVRRLGAALDLDGRIDDAVSLVISTSGTTGTPKGAQHTPATLAASARATEAFLGGPGNWLLALAPHHIAGLQVLLRPLRSGFTPAVLDIQAGFDTTGFAQAVRAFDGPRRYTSLVPTQLGKVLESPAATTALADVDAVLIGGAATPQPLQRRAIEAGIPIVRTYGMSETAGGCVYDGVPLDGVRIRIASPLDGVGRVLLGGPSIAHGYRNLPDHPAFAEPGWFRTDDLGRLDDGVLSIVGRADEAITSGGLTVIPQVVEAAILDDPAVADCAVVGLPDDRLGERVVAVVVPAPDATVRPAAVIDAVTERLGRYAAPREIIVADSLPRRGPGKVDRRALRARLTTPTANR